SSPAGSGHFPARDRPDRQSAAEPAAAASGDDVGRGASGGHGVRTHDVRPDVYPAAGWLGHALGGTLPDRRHRRPSVAVYSAARPNAICRPTKGAHHPGLRLLSAVPGPLRRNSISRPDRARRHLFANGALASPIATNPGSRASSTTGGGREAFAWALTHAE